jgi:hypothetical protein
MATTTLGDFKCMMCGHEYQEKVADVEFGFRISDFEFPPAYPEA